MRDGTRGEGSRPVVIRPEFAPQAMCLFEVEAGDPVQIRQFPSPLQLVGEPLVQLRTRLLREHPVCRVPEEGVVEAEPRLGRVDGLWPDHLASHQPFDPFRDLVTLGGRSEVADRTEREDLPDHGRPTKRHSVGRFEPVHTC